MTDAEPPISPAPRVAPRFQLRIWHLALLVVFVAVAIVQIQEQRPNDHGLVALACAGFVLYGALGWLGWRLARPLRARIGPTAVLVLFLIAMGGLFLLATWIYLGIEYIYTNHHFHDFYWSLW